MPTKLLGVAVVGSIAFLLATNPVVVDAAGQITGAQIKNNSVASTDIKNNSLKSGDVKDGSLTGADVQDGSLTGADVNEATLTGINASTLNGQPPASYLNTTYTFTLPITAATTSKTFTATLPAGTYLASYNIIATGSGPRCRLYSRTDIATAALGWSDAFQGNGVAWFASSTAVLTVPAGQAPALMCSGAAFGLYGGGDGTSSMSFTKLDTTIAGAATGGREAPSAKPGGLN